MVLAGEPEQGRAKVGNDVWRLIGALLFGVLATRHSLAPCGRGVSGAERGTRPTPPNRDASRDGYA